MRNIENILWNTFKSTFMEENSWTFHFLFQKNRFNFEILAVIFKELHILIEQKVCPKCVRQKNLYRNCFQQELQMNHQNPFLRTSFQIPKRPRTPTSAPQNFYDSKLNRSLKHSSSQITSPCIEANFKSLYSSKHSSCTENTRLQTLTLNEQELFPEDLIFLLRNEEKNINNFKHKMEKEKQKVQNDFAIFQTNVAHAIEDLKLSTQAKLDCVYREYIAIYGQIKKQIQKIRTFRKNFLTHNKNHLCKMHQTSLDKDFIKEVAIDTEYGRNFKIYGYVGEVVKERLVPVLKMANNLVVINSATCDFYRSIPLCQKLSQLKESVKAHSSHIHANLHEYIVTPEELLFKYRQASQSLQISKYHSPLKQSRAIPTEPFNLHNSFQVSLPSKHTTHSVVISSIPTIKHVEQINTAHDDSILCVCGFRGRYIATGSKDKTISIYNLEGKRLKTLGGHSSAICTLNTLNDQYLVSGGDYGCCRIMLWTISSNSLFYRKTAFHRAAVTSIVDVGDGAHLISGSYDKNIHIVNYHTDTLISRKSTKSAVISMTITSNKLICSTLDNSCTIWSIHHMEEVELVPRQTITQNVIVTQVISSGLTSQLVYLVCSDGEVKLYHVGSHQIESSIGHGGSVMEAVVLERVGSLPLTVVCSSKVDYLMFKANGTKAKIVTPPLEMKYGCGIGPKMAMITPTILAVVNQSPSVRQFYLCYFD